MPPAMAKRLFDLLGAALALLLLSPLLLVLALVVKLDSPGPVFFRQERVGRHRPAFPHPQVPHHGGRRAARGRR
jgi:lipopolysaccharide/colanic/teichoic acid biosynthesis glycosyltransferase